MKNEKLYKQAIEIAADSDERFRKVFAVNGNIEDQERKELHRRLEVQPAAAAACAQSELVATLFGVSDERVKWNNTNDNNGTAAQPFPYLASNVFDYLNNTLLPKFPAEVRAVMKERIALTEQRYSASAKLTASNGWAWKPIGRLWLPSEPELFGRNQWGDPYGDAVSSQLSVFRDPGDRIFRTPDGERSNVWSRSVAAGNAVNACYANAYGHANSTSTSYGSIGVAPGFLIG